MLARQIPRGVWEVNEGGLRKPERGGLEGAGEGPWLEQGLGQTAVGRLQAVLMAQKCPSAASSLPGPCCLFTPLNPSPALTPGALKLCPPPRMGLPSPEPRPTHTLPTNPQPSPSG